MSKKTLVIGGFLMIIAFGLGLFLLHPDPQEKIAGLEDVKSYQIALLEAKGHYDGLEHDIGYLRSTGQTQFIPRIADHQEAIIRKMKEWTAIIPNEVPPEVRTLLQKVG